MPDELKDTTNELENEQKEGFVEGSYIAIKELKYPSDVDYTLTLEHGEIIYMGYIPPDKVDFFESNLCEKKGVLDLENKSEEELDKYGIRKLKKKELPMLNIRRNINWIGFLRESGTRFLCDKAFENTGDEYKKYKEFLYAVNDKNITFSINCYDEDGGKTPFDECHSIEDFRNVLIGRFDGKISGDPQSDSIREKFEEWEKNRQEND